MQVIVTRELGDEYIWLKALSNRLKKEDAIKLTEEAEEKERTGYYSKSKCAFTAHLRPNALSFPEGFAYREAIFNGKTRYYSQTERL